MNQMMHVWKRSEEQKKKAKKDLKEGFVKETTTRKTMNQKEEQFGLVP